MRNARAVPVIWLARADGAWAAATALAAFAVYVRTLAPGVVPILDTPGFQFVGRVLGTLHNPGYPTYTVITWLWSYLPIGNLAYRINLFSAVTASLAVAGAFVLMRLLGVRRMVAAGGALGMAFGSIYWSQAVIAEVYGLNAALVAWTLVAIVSWGITGRAVLFFAAWGLLALGLGNHTTIVLLGPALVIYVLITNPGFALRIRTVAVAAAILLLGLSQYLFILVRTRMGAIYLESRASTIGELFDVMRGVQFESALFAFSASEVLGDRIPLIFGTFGSAEMTVPVLALAILGMIALVARRRYEAALLLVSLAAQILFVLNYDAGDIHVFTIPTLLLLWVLAASGVEFILERLDSRARAAVVATSVLAACFPIWQAARNFTERDLSDDTPAMRQLDALFAALPDDSFLVRENFVLDRMLMYKIIGEGAGGEREIQAHHTTAAAAGSMHASGRHVFTFSETSHAYRYEGLNVRFSPFVVYESTLTEFLASLPDGTIVALAVPGAHAAAFHHTAGSALTSLTTVGSTAGREQAAIAFIAIVGEPSAARVQLDARSPAIVSLDDLRVQADAVSAAVEVAGRERVRGDEGAVLAVLTPERQVQSLRVLSAEAGFRIRAGESPFVPAEVLGPMASRQVPDTWTDIGEGTGLWLFTLPAAARVGITATGGPDCDLEVVEKSTNTLQTTAAEPGGLVLAASEPGAAFVTTGCRARLSVRGTGSASVREASLAGILDLPDRAVDTVLMARTRQSWLVGRGWSPVDASPAGPFRWIEGPLASLLLPVGRTGSTRLRVQVFKQGARDVQFTPVLDGTALEVRPLQEGWHWYEWSLERQVTPGSHELRFEVLQSSGGDGSWAPVAVSQIEVLPPRRW